MLGLQPATFEEFEAEARRGNVVPVVRSLLADLQTPVGAFLRVADSSAHAFLLESIEGGERVARYSFLGADPELIIRGRGDSTVVERLGFRPEIYKGARAVDYLRAYFASRRLARRPGLAPLAGGAVGYLAYEAARWFEPALEKDLRAEGDGDDAVFMVCRMVLSFDRVRQRIEIASVVMTDEAGGDRARLRELYEAAAAETASVAAQLGEGVAGEGTNARGGVEPGLASGWAREKFEAAVERVKERIAAGDCHQAVLAQSFSRRVSAGPVQVYRALRAAHPSPYMFFLKLGEESVFGASREMLVRCRGRRLDSRALSGARKRGATETEDWLLGEELRADEREVARHALLVDLARGDVGRVAEYGSIEVGELMTVERYADAQHLVTTLRARLRGDCDRFDALAACLPAGSVAGAPKASAVRLAAGLEPGPRGVFGGAVLYADHADNLDSCVAVRTLVLRNSVAEARAVAVVAADSVAAREYEETFREARALLAAVELAERGL